MAKQEDKITLRQSDDLPSSDGANSEPVDSSQHANVNDPASPPIIASAANDSSSDTIGKSAAQPAENFGESRSLTIEAADPRESTAAEQVIPSRKTRRMSLMPMIYLLACIAFLVPIVAMQMMMRSDPAGPSYLCGVLNVAFGSPQEAISNFSEALAIRKDPIFYADRAGAYKKTGKIDKQISDLKAAAALGFPDKQVYPDLADSLVLDGRPRAEIIPALEKLVRLYPYVGWHGALEALLCYDTPQAVLRQSEIVTSSDSSDQTTVNTVKALAYRELGQQDLALSFINRVNPDDLGIGEESGPPRHFYKALFALDKNDLAGAEREIAALDADKADAEYCQFGTAPLIRAWLLYARGEYAQALAQIDDKHYEVDIDLNSGVGDVWGRDRLAAVRLLRQHILLKLGKGAEAAKEFKAYKDLKYDGKIFVPMPYRSWIVN